MRSSLFAAVLVLFPLGLACGGGGLTDNLPILDYRSTVKSWEGHDANTLIRVWGTPVRQFTMPNGHVNYVYLTATQFDLGRALTCEPKQGGGDNCYLSGDHKVDLECVTTFEVDGQRVVFTQVEGASCVLANPVPAGAVPLAGAVQTHAIAPAAAPVATDVPAPGDGTIPAADPADVSVDGADPADEPSALGRAGRPKKKLKLRRDRAEQ